MPANDELAWFQPVLDYANFTNKDDVRRNGGKLKIRMDGDDDLGRLHNKLNESGMFSPRGIVWPATRLNILVNPKEWSNRKKLVEEHANLCRILNGIVVKRRATQKTFSDIWESGSALPVKGSATVLRETGQSVTWLDVKPQTIAEWYSFSIAELISQELDSKLRRCQWKKCKDFFLDVKSRGHKRKYCCNDHGSRVRMLKKRLNDAARGIA